MIQHANNLSYHVDQIRGLPNLPVRNQFYGSNFILPYGYSYSTSSTVHNHYAVDSDGIVACACGKIFTGNPKNANANRKRHIHTKSEGHVFYACPNAHRGCHYGATRKDNVTAHSHRACRYSSDAPMEKEGDEDRGAPVTSPP